MTELFSVVFVGIFVIFGVAALVGHVLLAQALVRPFRQAPGEEAAGDPRPAGELILDNPQKAVSGAFGPSVVPHPAAFPHTASARLAEHPPAG